MMKTARAKRLTWIIVMIVSVAVASLIVLYALQDNINLYYTPKQLIAAQPTSDRTIRLGGMIVDGSVKHGESLEVDFVLTDGHATVPVHYVGVLPALFKEGQGIVAEGQFEHGVFDADTVLAKHDENYMPPEIT